MDVCAFQILGKSWLAAALVDKAERWLLITGEMRRVGFGCGGGLDLRYFKWEGR